MIKTFFLTLLFGLLNFLALAQHPVSACVASPGPVLINNGGHPLAIIGRGTARKSWTETPEGYLLKQNKDYVYEYVVQDKNGRLVLSGVAAAVRSPALKGRHNFVKAAPETIQKIASGKPFGLENISAIAASGTAGITAFTATAMPTTGSIRVLCLLVDYPDLGQTYSKTDLESLLNQPNFGGTGSFKDYFTSSSFGKLDVTVDVVDWVTAPNNYEYYGRANGYGRARELVRFAVDQAELNGVDFSLYDNDSDGDVDGIMVVHAGQGAEEGAQTQYIWSHRSSIPTVTYDGKAIRDYIINPETRASGSITTIGVFCHEFGHNLGLPDLYDTDGSSQGIGNWGLMGSASWLGGGKRPGGLSAWSKIKLGWQVPVEIIANGSYTLNPAATHEEILLLYPGESKEYFLLENRQKTGVDSNLPGSGLAIWHIDDARYGNADETHKRVDLEEADGLNGLDGSSRGDGGDLYPGTSGNSAFNATSNPNNALYSGAPGLARLLNITQNPDKTITFNADLDNIRFFPHDTLAFPSVATGRTHGKSFGLKAFNYDYVVTAVTYPEGFSGTLAAGDTVKAGARAEYRLVFKPQVAKTYTGSIVISGTANGTAITGSVPVKGTALQTLFADDFGTDKGWQLTGGFARGMPQGLAGDPDSALVSPNVLGTVLGGSGQYANNLANRQWVAVSPPFSCYGYTDIRLTYQQWLNLNSYNEDFAYLDVSVDGGATWLEVLRYGDYEFTQDYWWQVMRNLSDYVAWQEDVRLRFSLGATNATGARGGWNIDDLVVTGRADFFRLEANLAFGPTGIGVNQTRQLELKNGTGSDFTITALSLPAGYSATLGPGDVVPAGSSKMFTLTLTPLAEVAYTGNFELAFSGGGQTYALTEPLSGRGVYLIFADDFETNKSWQLTGGFVRGAPLGRGYDPIRAFSGARVLGTVLEGNGRYENGLHDRQWTATSPVVDCSGFTGVKLNFARYNQIDGYADSAYIDVSTDAGATWNQVWSTGGRWVGDWQWSAQTLDISALADGQSEVMVRFALGATDSAWVNGGWNIDNLVLYGSTAAAVAVTPWLDYGHVPVGSTAVQDITITNVGAQDLVVSGLVYPPGFTGADFSGTLASGVSHTLPVTFAPAAVRPYADTLKIISNAATGTDRVVVRGTGTGAVLRANYPASLGEVWVDSTLSAIFYLVNDGNADLVISGITHSLPQFNGNWSGTVAAGDSVALAVAFTPTAAQGYSNTLTIANNGIAGDLTLTVTGTGVEVSRLALLLPAHYAFGPVQVDSAQTGFIYLKNTGNADLTVTALTHTNSAFSGTWDGTLGPLDSVAVPLGFMPGAAGRFTDTLRVISDATNGPVQAVLTGEGVANHRHLVLSVSHIDFGAVRIDSLGQYTLQVRNSGNVPLTITGISLAGPAFAVDWQARTLAPDSAAELRVTFEPPARLTYADTLVFYSNADPGAYKVALSGRGVAGIISLSTALDFGAVPLGEEKTDTLTITNTGDASFAVTAMAVDHPAFRVDWSGELAPGAEQPVAVTFRPAEAVPFSATLRLQHTASDGPDSLLLTGQGLDIVAGLDDGLHNLTVYPNPSTGTIYIHNPGKIPVPFQVLDKAGKLVMTGETKGELNLWALADGLYTVRLINPKGAATFTIVIKQ